MCGGEIANAVSRWARLGRDEQVGEGQGLRFIVSHQHHGRRHQHP